MISDSKHGPPQQDQGPPAPPPYDPSRATASAPPQSGYAPPQGSPNTQNQPVVLSPPMSPPPQGQGYGHPAQQQQQYPMSPMPQQQPGLQPGMHPGMPPQPMHSGMSPPGAMQQGPYGPDVGAQYQQQLWARCARGEHDIKTEYGIFGIIMAVICFPCGLICLFTDSEKKCARCGVPLGT